MFNLPRASGILLHPTSLPGAQGIGEIGPHCHRFLEHLAKMGQTLWQTLPLGPTGYGNSPYQCHSTFAGNPLLISMESLLTDGLLRADDFNAFPHFPEHRVDFGPLIEVKMAVLRHACQRFRMQDKLSSLFHDAFESFCTAESAWLDDYALYSALKTHHKLRPWTEWPKPYARREPEALAAAMATLEEEIEDAKILQFLFHRQWSRVREKAKSLGIKIIGDIPIFVAHDSADCWANPELFSLDDHGMPTVVAGVPPDYFSATGQLWGNPLYCWEEHAKDDYAWWAARLGKAFEWFDFVRVDHFRGFAGYWEIPAGEDTAINGRWVTGPGADLFEKLEQRMGKIPLIAEDLGIITPDVVELRDRFQFPGMRVMQFAFGADSMAPEYIPENYPPHSVAYTGTHDNDTTLGLFRSEAGEGSTRSPEMVQAERRTILAYTGTDGHELNWDYIHRVAHSAADMAIYPLQDVLGLGSEARINTPGQAGDNWSWRFTWEQLEPWMEERLGRETQESGRRLEQRG